MLDHLLNLPDILFEPDIDAGSAKPFTPVDKLDAAQQLEGKLQTAQLFDSLGVVDDEELDQERSRAEAQQAFAALIAGDEKTQVRAVTQLSLPASVRDSIAMLTQYQWDFVQQASELRSMAVSKLVKESDHPDARIRLRALELLGKVTEVALFTDRVEVRKTDTKPEDLEKLIREKLDKFAKHMAPQDTTVTDVDILEENSNEHIRETKQLDSEAISASCEDPTTEQTTN